MEYIKALRTQLRYTGTAECSMEQGTMRVDANISIRPEGTSEFNTKVEVKNMNSIRNVGDAIAYEITRQTECLEKGEAIILHTRLWDPDKRVTTAMRGKFAGPCVPDPSVAKIRVTEDWLKRMQERLPEMPAKKAERFVTEYGLTPDEALAMSLDRDISEFFEDTAKRGLPPHKVTNWITTHLAPMLKDRNQTIEETALTAERFARLLAMLEKGVINAHGAREILLKLLESNESPEDLVEKGQFRQVSDTSELEGIIDGIIADHSADVEDFRKGNEKVVGFLMGLAMKASKGKANPKLLREMLVKRLA